MLQEGLEIKIAFSSKFLYCACLPWRSQPKYWGVQKILGGVKCLIAGE